MVNCESYRTVAIFTLGEARFALSTSVIEMVIRAAEVSPLSDAPAGVLGLLNLHGRVIPVWDIRPRFGVPSREIGVDDHFVIARAGDRDVAILVDGTVDVVAAEGAAAPLSVDALAGLPGVQGAVVQGGSIVPIQDLTRILPADPRRSGELKLVA